MTAITTITTIYKSREELRNLSESILTTFYLAHNIRPCEEPEVYPNMTMDFPDGSAFENIDVLELHGLTTEEITKETLTKDFEDFLKAYNSAVPEFSKFMPYAVKVFKNKNITSVYVSLFY